MDILTKVNWVDVLVVIVFLRTSYVSFKWGFLKGLLPLLGSVAMTVISLSCFSKLAVNISENFFNMQLEVADLMAFVILVIATGIAFRIFKLVLDMLLNIELPGLLDRAGAAVCGAIRGIISASLVLMVLVMIPVPYFQYSILEQSVTGRYVVVVGPFIYEKAVLAMPSLRGEFGPEDMRQMMDRIKPDKTIKMDLPSRRDSASDWEKVANF